MLRDGIVDKCPVCLQAFQPGDVIAQDVELLTCHAECLLGSAIVNIETGEPDPDAEITTHRYETSSPAAVDPATFSFIIERAKSYAKAIPPTVSRQGSLTEAYIAGALYAFSYQRVKNDAPEGVDWNSISDDDFVAEATPMGNGFRSDSLG